MLAKSPVLFNSRINRSATGTPVRYTVIAPSRGGVNRSENKQMKFNTRRNTYLRTNNRNFKPRNNNAYKGRGAFRRTPDFGKVLPLNNAAANSSGLVLRMMLLAAKNRSSGSKEAIAGIAKIIRRLNGKFNKKFPKTRLTSKCKKQSKSRTKTNIFLQTVFNPRSVITVQGLSTALTSFITLKRILVRGKRYYRQRSGEVGLYKGTILGIFSKYKGLTKTFSAFPVKVCMSSFFSNVLSRHTLASNKQGPLKKKMSSFLKKWIFKKSNPGRIPISRQVDTRFAVRRYNLLKFEQENYEAHKFNKHKKFSKIVKKVKDPKWPHTVSTFNHYTDRSPSFIYSNLSGADTNIIFVIGRINLIFLRMYLLAKKKISLYKKNNKWSRVAKAKEDKSILDSILTALADFTQKFFISFFSTKKIDVASMSALSGQSIRRTERLDDNLLSRGTIFKEFSFKCATAKEITKQKMGALSEIHFFKKFAVQASNRLNKLKTMYYEQSCDNLYGTWYGAGTGTARLFNSFIKSECNPFFLWNRSTINGWLKVSSITKDARTDPRLLGRSNRYHRLNTSAGTSAFSGPLMQKGGFYKDKYVAFTSTYNKNIFLQSLSKLTTILRRFKMSNRGIRWILTKALSNKTASTDDILHKFPKRKTSKKTIRNSASLKKYKLSPFPDNDIRTVVSYNPKLRSWYKSILKRVAANKRAGNPNAYAFMKNTAIPIKSIFKRIHADFRRYKQSYVGAIARTIRAVGGKTLRYKNTAENARKKAYDVFTPQAKPNTWNYASNRYWRFFVYNKLAKSLITTASGVVYPTKFFYEKRSAAIGKFYLSLLKSKHSLIQRTRDYYKHKIILRHVFMQWWGIHKVKTIEHIRKQFIYNNTNRWGYYYNLFHNRTSQFLYDINWLGTGTLDNYRWLLRAGVMFHQSKLMATARADSRIKSGNMFSLPNETFSYFKAKALKRFINYNTTLGRSPRVDEKKKKVLASIFYKKGNDLARTQDAETVDFIKHQVFSSAQNKKIRGSFYSKAPSLDHLYHYALPKSVLHTTDGKFRAKYDNNIEVYKDTFISTFNTLKRSSNFFKTLYSADSPQLVLYPLTVTEFFIKDRNVLYVLRKPRDFTEMHLHSRYFNAQLNNKLETHKSLYDFLFYKRSYGR